MWFPPIPGTRAQHWLFKTPDGREAVSRFYADEAHRRGWRSAEEAAGGYLMLRKGAACLEVLASESALGGEGRETTIVYTLREECAGARQPQSRNPLVIALTTGMPLEAMALNRALAPPRQRRRS